MNYSITTNKPSKQHGLSLIEILIAMILVLILTAGLISMYSSNKQSFTTQESVSRIQESARFASELLQKELRSAGYYGCNQETLMVDALNATPFLANHTRPIEGFNATDLANWNQAIATTGLAIGTAVGDFVRGGTDILIVRRASDAQTPLNTAMGTTSDDLQIVGAINPAVFAVNDIAIVSDCKRSAIFQVTGFTQATGIIQHATAGGSIGNSTTQLLSSAPAFNTDASVMKLQTTVFFVGTSTNGTPSLRRKVDGAVSEVLVHGVENMQVLYGLDTDTDGIANRYVTAANITAAEWVNVTSARIALLMISPQNALTQNDTNPYSLLDENIADTGTTITHAGDLRLRQVVTMTIDVRNI